MEKFIISSYARIVFGLLSAAFVFAQNAPPPVVLVELAEDSVELNSPFLVTLLVSESDMTKIEIDVPESDGGFRIIKEERTVRVLRPSALNSQRFASFTYTMIALIEGRISIKPFAVNVEGNIVQTEELFVLVTPKKHDSVIKPIFSWQGGNSALKVGVWTTFTLTSNIKNIPRDALKTLRFPPPPSAIVETVIEKDGIILLKVLPLETGTFYIKKIESAWRSESGSNYEINIPALERMIRE